MKAKKINFLDWNNKVFASSIKRINLNIIIIIILDSVFYLSFWYIIFFWLQRIQEKIASVILPSQEEIIALGQQKAAQLLAQEKSFYYFLIISFLLLLLAIILLASIIKGIIWAKTANAKITFALISKFLGLNLAWMPLWFALVFLISKFVELRSAPAFMAAAIMLAFYFTNTLYALFMQKPHIKTISEAIKLNFSKIHMFLLPYTIIFLVLFLIIILNGVLAFSHSMLVFGLIAVAYFAFVRYYAYQLILEVRKL